MPNMWCASSFGQAPSPPPLPPHSPPSRCTHHALPVSVNPSGDFHATSSSLTLTTLQYDASRSLVPLRGMETWLLLMFPLLLTLVPHPGCTPFLPVLLSLCHAALLCTQKPIDHCATTLLPTLHVLCFCVDVKIYILFALKSLQYMEWWLFTFPYNDNSRQ